VADNPGESMVAAFDNQMKGIREGLTGTTDENRVQRRDEWLADTDKDAGERRTQNDQDLADAQKQLADAIAEAQKVTERPEEPTAPEGLAETQEKVKAAVENVGTLDLKGPARGTFYSQGIQALQTSSPQREMVGRLDRLIDIDLDLLRETKQNRLQFTG